ncbi:hypothetical protein FQR65_LT03929 [Abscondita terminalis]|nr:hypothetical protein FQR65_LT03929 [Abscondita terminalis]
MIYWSHAMNNQEHQLKLNNEHPYVYAFISAMLERQVEALEFFRNKLQSIDSLSPKRKVAYNKGHFSADDVGMVDFCLRYLREDNTLTGSYSFESAKRLFENLKSEDLSPEDYSTSMFGALDSLVSVPDDSFIKPGSDMLTSMWNRCGFETHKQHFLDKLGIGYASRNRIACLIKKNVDIKVLPEIIKSLNQEQMQFIMEEDKSIHEIFTKIIKSGVVGEIMASVDINQTANKVYAHNFTSTLLLNRNIQSLSPEYINTLGIDTILLSPPCQPFTRNGLKQDVNDPRTSSFLHIINILSKLNVQNILLENVKGFEASEMRNVFVKELGKCGFTYQEFLLSPSQFGIPNTRCRYYCVAKKRPAAFRFQTGPLMENFPALSVEVVQEPYPISKILQDIDFTDYYIPDSILLKRATTLDICFKDSKRSCCFTKSYGRYVTGTGSVYTDKTKEELDSVYNELNKYTDDSESYLNCIKKLQLRFFTPREVCRLMCFPEYFQIPRDITDKQMYMLLGNSINIKVVSELIKLLSE